MADIYITQYARMADGERGFLQCGEEPNLGTLTIAIGVASAQSATLDPATRFVCISAEAACSVQFGANPTAVKATSTRIPAVGERWFGIEGNLARSGCKVAVIE